MDQALRIGTRVLAVHFDPVEAFMTRVRPGAAATEAGKRGPRPIDVPALLAALDLDPDQLIEPQTFARTVLGSFGIHAGMGRMGGERAPRRVADLARALASDLARPMPADQLIDRLLAWLGDVRCRRDESVLERRAFLEQPPLARAIVIGEVVRREPLRTTVQGRAFRLAPGGGRYLAVSRAGDRYALEWARWRLDATWLAERPNETFLELVRAEVIEAWRFLAAAPPKAAPETPITASRPARKAASPRAPAPVPSGSEW